MTANGRRLDPRSSVAGFAGLLRRRSVAAGTLAATLAVAGVVTFQGLPAVSDGQPAVTPSVGRLTPTPPEPTPTEPTAAETTAPPDSTTAPPDPFEDAVAWLAALPVGEPLRLPYTTQTELVDGATRVPLPPQDPPAESSELFEVIARTGESAGAAWLVKAYPQSGNNNDAARIGRLKRTGAFVELASEPSGLDVAVSPDGSMLALTAAPFRPGAPVRVIASTDGAEIAVLEMTTHEWLVGWATSGLVLVDYGTSGSVRVAGIDGSSQPITASSATLLDPAADLAVLGRAADGCSRVVRLSAPDVALREFCGGVGTVSPDARWRVGLDPPGDHQFGLERVLDLQTGARTSLPLPALQDGLSHAGWEDADTVLFTASFALDDQTNLIGVIRCSVSALRCEVALPAAPYDQGPPYDVMGNP